MAEAGVTAAERLAESAWGVYGVMLEHLSVVQQRNVRFAQEMVDRWIEELRDRVEDDREAARRLAESAARQQEALRDLLRESADAYVELLYAPLRHYGEQLEAPARGERG
ncbi:hypothetical protein Rxyl_2391 [Rubrobacter xylanophilus DSM 9941]|uniref:Phasin domain-containing protein n=1 Tax=Rubrobacter xylanophilus (strain DSM 9941 / JCM 11954 / NBRC 16129 / PRD-1) TaxID=266117 RepID=Q1ATF9_RUBXD|nr:hypothetical protein [Rubrobacter xylanophilus]ABG05319.1 hypothetical protein Rxyl_2391 [Rubrobacter xylanophilus DSM 9941]